MNGLRHILIVTALHSCILFYSAGCAYGEGADWKFFSESASNRWYYETSTVDYSRKELVRVWGKAVTKGKEGIDEKIKLLEKFGGQTRGYEKYSYTMNLFELDCVRKKSRILSVKDYDLKGNPLESVSIENFPWDFIAPGTIIENLYKTVCRDK